MRCVDNKETDEQTIILDKNEGCIVISEDGDTNVFVRLPDKGRLSDLPPYKIMLLSIYNALCNEPDVVKAMLAIYINSCSYVDFTTLNTTTH